MSGTSSRLTSTTTTSRHAPLIAFTIRDLKTHVQVRECSGSRSCRLGLIVIRGPAIAPSRCVSRLHERSSPLHPAPPESAD